MYKCDVYVFVCMYECINASKDFRNSLSKWGYISVYLHRQVNNKTKENQDTYRGEMHTTVNRDKSKYFKYLYLYVNS